LPTCCFSKLHLTLLRRRTLNSRGKEAKWRSPESSYLLFFPALQANDLFYFII
jgi:hypothetical protein